MLHKPAQTTTSTKHVIQNSIYPHWQLTQKIEILVYYVGTSTYDDELEIVVSWYR